MCVSFEQELKANKQIKANLHKELGREVTSLAEVLRDHEVAKKFMHTKFEIVDKGSMHMRCAVKTT